MPKEKKKKGKFKSMGANILKPRAQSCKSAFAQNPKSIKSYSDRDVNPFDKNKPFNKSEHADEVVRIHVHIRKDLADKLFKAVYINKLSRDKEIRATQRLIIERALESYFDKKNEL